MSADDYEVGYGKPPVHTRFQKGKSGNPRGRPRKVPVVFENKLEEALQRPVEVFDRETKRRVPMSEVLYRKLIMEALKGDFKALIQVLHRELELQQMVAEEHGTGKRIPEALGYMLAPEQLSLHEWEKQAMANQERLVAETYRPVAL